MSTKPMTILFQGDSITDGNRGRNDDPNHILGHSYVYMIAAELDVQLAELRPYLSTEGSVGIELQICMHVGTRTRSA